jgi:hypothetical protein
MSSSRHRAGSSRLVWFFEIFKLGALKHARIGKSVKTGARGAQAKGATWGVLGCPKSIGSRVRDPCHVTPDVIRGGGIFS